MTENRITELWNKAVAEIGDCTYPQIITRFAELVAADGVSATQLKKFAELVAAVEREACAKLADAHFIFGHSVAGPHFAAALAAKIRERSNVLADRREPIGEASSPKGDGRAAG